MGWGFEPYVSVAERRRQAITKMDKLRKQGMDIQPVEIEGRTIVRTFWGKSWCGHLESFSDYSNRLSRGRTYVRNGSVCHLEITGGQVKAKVSGSKLYDVKIKIKELPQKKWQSVKERCSGKIGSLLELLQGRLSTAVMTVVTDQSEGLFPQPSEISLDCSCPDGAVMCKHVAAVLYGVGARLDSKPELLFLLRGVNHDDLIEADAVAAASVGGSKRGGRRIAESELGDLFGIEMLVADSCPLSLDESSLNKDISANRQSSSSSIANEIGIDVDTRPIKKHTSSRPTTGTGKISSQKVIGAKSKRNIVASDPSPTGKSVRDLRARLDFSQKQLAQLIGVSAASVAAWEKESGLLRLQPRTLTALHAVENLTKKEAVKRLAQAAITKL